VITCEIKLFHPSSTSVWSNCISGRGITPKIISEHYCSSWIFSNMFSVEKWFWNNFDTRSVAEI